LRLAIRSIAAAIQAIASRIGLRLGAAWNARRGAKCPTILGLVAFEGVGTFLARSPFWRSCPGGSMSHTCTRRTLALISYAGLFVATLLVSACGTTDDGASGASGSGAASA